MKIVNAQGGAECELKLTSTEIRLISAFRRLHDEAQDCSLAIVEKCSANPGLTRQPSKPSLRVVKGGTA